MAQLNTSVDPLHYLGTVKGRRIDKLQNKIHEKLVNECTAFDIGHAIVNSSDEIMNNIEICFHTARAEKLYQLITNLMYERFKEKAIEKALEIGEYEY